MCFVFLFLCAAGAGSAKLSYVLLQKLLKLAEFLPRRRDPAAPADDPTPADSDASGNSSNGNTGNGNTSNGNNINGSTSNGNNSNGNTSNGNSSSGGNGGGGFCFKYVITDFSHANFGFWMNHPRLQDLFTLGIIDFAVFDAEADKGGIGGERPGQPKKDEDEDEKEEGAAAAAPAGESDGQANGSGLEPGVGLWGSGCLRLELSGEEIRPGDLENPVIVVANYVFDSLKQDAFRWGRGFCRSKGGGEGRVGWGVLA